jgi:hypothetical protein
MATPNKGLEQPARGSLVGVWDTPLNSNSDIIDASFGGITTIALTNSPVSLSSAQYRNIFITFTGALSGNCAITFPTVGSIYTIQNLTSNTSAFQVTLQTTAAGSQAIGAPWGEAFDIMTDTSGNVKFRNLGRVGSEMRFWGSSVPTWISNCTVPPYLNMDGTAFSSATYPVLATILGGTTLPDAQGRYTATLNQGTARITSGSSTGGVDGNTNLAAGGSQTTTLSSQNMPPILITDPGHLHAFTAGGVSTATGAETRTNTVVNNLNTASAVTGITAGSTSPTNFSNLPPTIMGGILMIRAG